MLCKSLGILDFEVEGESTIVVNAVKNGTMKNWRLKYLWRECLDLIEVQRSKIQHVFRQANWVVDRLAAWAYDHRTFKECFLVSELPEEGKTNMRMDRLEIWTYHRYDIFFSSCMYRAFPAYFFFFLVSM